MKIAMEAEGTDTLDDRFTAMPQQLQAQLAAKAQAMAELLRQRIAEKLDGEVLQRRSGRLAASVEIDTDVSADGIAIVARAGEGVPYAAIQEQGGTTRAHDIVPDRAKALSFLTAGKRVFAAIVHHPGSYLPARSYLASSLAELEDQFSAMLAEAVADGVSS